MSDDHEEQYTVEVTEPFVEGRGVNIDDFYAYMPSHGYIFTPCREFWAAASVNARLPRMPVLKANGQPKHSNGKPVTISATTWLDQNRAVEQLTWCPGEPMPIRDRLVVDGGWIERKDVACFNLYRPPRIALGDAANAGPWIEHVHRVYPDDASHIIQWLAQRVQHPANKINHALVLGGAQGIGKDTLLEPIKYAVGPWNFHEVSPTQLLGRFNSFAKSIILRVSEARDLGEVDRFKFYDHAKIYTAAPPDVFRVDEKNLREHYVFNCLGFIITTNHKTDGIYLPADDRRHFVAWSSRNKDEFAAGYWQRLWGWYQNGGYGHVAAYLSELDLTGFDAKAPPSKTPAFWDIVNANTAPEDIDLANLLDQMQNPDALTPKQMMAAAVGDTAEWLFKNRRSIPHRLERCGYSPIQNTAAKDGYWRVNDERQPVYCKITLSVEQKLAAARKLSLTGEGAP
jgi:hypothetical protein